MKNIRIAIVLAVVLALLIPMTVNAAGTFYCSSLIASGGDGSYAYPWACADQTQLDYIIYDVICNQYSGGVLFRILATSYIYYQIEWLVVDGQSVCTITNSAEFPGYPPDTGVELPAPVIIGGIAALGGALILAGMYIRRKRSMA